MFLSCFINEWCVKVYLPTISIIDIFSNLRLVRAGMTQMNDQRLAAKNVQKCLRHFQHLRVFGLEVPWEGPVLYRVRSHGMESPKSFRLNHQKRKMWGLCSGNPPLKQPYKSYRVPLLTLISGTSYIIYLHKFADEKMVHGNLQRKELEDDFATAVEKALSLPQQSVTFFRTFRNCFF